MGCSSDTSLRPLVSSIAMISDFRKATLLTGVLMWMLDQHERFLCNVPGKWSAILGVSLTGFAGCCCAKSEHKQRCGSNDVPVDRHCCSCGWKPKSS